MQCANCGVDVIEGSAFCPSCGKPTTAGLAAPVTNSLQPNVAGFLCYVVGFISGIFFLIVDPYKRNQFVRFHAFQSIFLSVGWTALYLLLGVAFAVLPGALWSVSLMLNSLLSLAVFLLWLFLMYKAYSNERFKLPVIGDLAERQAQQTESAPRASA
jgi:uncharacterized membrane protein